MAKTAELSPDERRVRAQKRHAAERIQEQYRDQWPMSEQHPHCGVCRSRGAVWLPKGFQSPYFHRIREVVENEWPKDFGFGVTFRAWAALWQAALEQAGWTWVPMKKFWQCPTCSNREGQVPADPQLTLWDI